MGDNQGLSGGIQTTDAIAMTMVSFLAISFYNVLELCVIISVTFKRRRGLYYWSLQTATLGIAIYSLGFAFKFFQVIRVDMLSMSLVVFGWYCMVTGQSVVLYSRLGLIVRNPTKIRWILIMIISNAIIGHIPTSVFAFGANSPKPGPFVPLYAAYEKVQVTLFFVQETVISGLYVYETVKFLKPASNIKGPRARKVMTHLIYVNIMIILMDITLLGTEYSGHYEIQTTYKAALYSIKLKIEFSILNQLREITQATSQASYAQGGDSVALDTLRRGKHPKRATRISIGHNAYAEMDRSHEVEVEDGTISVVKTTQVQVDEITPVSRDGASTRNEECLEATQGKSGPAWTKPKSGRLSPSSSELQFAERGFYSSG
ncbi:hypothetical protein CC80DRAFT_470363 [Byssothecium circinans]|uniref:DUF7703 domain-containing protein n=1 Tax=Byssothecium circinans TaxID=147558 RepID=A0A6A5TYZ4_9PLEO|nr:hypothetical protein CC80DRAFT_470363 [Byssothecium circinans]